MPKYATIDIAESLEFLGKLHARYKEERTRKRINMLIHLKENTFRTRQELSDSLSIGKRTLERWVKKYESQGIETFLGKESRNKKSKFINDSIEADLIKKLHDPYDSFTSYVDIQNWLLQEHQCDIKYDNLYYYLRTHFKTKLKVPRKSNINKDDKAVAFFKNA